MNRIDFKINSLISYILQILVICSILCVLSVFQEILSVRLSERILALIGFCTCSIFFCRYHSLLDKVGWVYCISLLVISIVHTDMVTVENTFMSSVRWLNIFLLILLYKNLNLNTRWLLYFAFVFYITECGICIIEKLGKFYVIDYSMADSMQATNAKAYQYTFMDFRSRGLLLHPLYNANVISIFMGYILVSSRLKRYFQIILLLLGLFAVWSCNSRGCIAVWLLILTYRLFFYKQNVWKVLIALFFLYMIIPNVIVLVQQSGLLGRFNFDFSDSSSETRLTAFELFFIYPWKTEDIVYGLGDWIYYPFTEIRLENGFLLNLSYWGWIVGSIKSFAEIYLTYKCLSFYSFNDKIIIMLAIWGVASLNNNMTYIMLLSFFLLANIFLNTENHCGMKIKNIFFLFKK